MKKRGAMGTGAAVILMIVTVLVLINWLGPSIGNAAEPFFSLFGVGEDKEEDKESRPLSPAEKTFQSFLISYENCKKYTSRNCLCDEFDVTKIPEGYSIKLENLDKKGTRIGLYEKYKDVAEPSDVIENDKFCFYEYKKEKGTFSITDAKEAVLDPTKYDFSYKVNNKVQLYKYSKDIICFVSGTYSSKEFNEIKGARLKCNLKDKGVKTLKSGILDFSDYTDDYPRLNFVTNKDEEASKIIEKLGIFLLNNLGKVTSITEYLGTSQLRLERRENMFNYAYKNFDENQDGFISNDAYFVSIRTLQIKKENSPIKRDYFKIHYLKGSEQGKALAEKIKSKLEELNGKVIVDRAGDKKFSVAETGKIYQFNFQIEMEENSKEKVGPVFLTCTGDYNNFVTELKGYPCKESTSLPAVFIDIVEVFEKEGNHDIFEQHSKTIAEKIYRGVEEFLVSQPTMGELFDCNSFGKLADCKAHNDVCYPSFKDDGSTFDKCNACQGTFDCNKISSNSDCAPTTLCEEACDQDYCKADCFYRLSGEASELKGTCHSIKEQHVWDKAAGFDECINIKGYPVVYGAKIYCRRCPGDLDGDLQCKQIRWEKGNPLTHDQVEKTCKADICQLNCGFFNNECYPKIKYHETCDDENRKIANKEKCINKLESLQSKFDWKPGIVDISITIEGITWQYWGNDVGRDNGQHWWMRSDFSPNKQCPDDLMFDSSLSNYFICNTNQNLVSSNFFGAKRTEDIKSIFLS